MANTAQQTPNNAQTTLASGLSSGGTTVSITAATNFPSSGNSYTAMICLQSIVAGIPTYTNIEYVTVTPSAGTTLTIARGVEGTVGVSHSAGELFTAIISNGVMGSLKQGYWPYLAPGGNTGATAATRYMGATTSGAPTSGSFLAGDFVISQTGKVYVCTALGTPGTWVSNGITAATTATGSTTAATSYGDLAATTGPAVTITTGTTAIVISGASFANTANTGISYMGYVISGATTLAATDATAAFYQAFTANAAGGNSYVAFQAGLTPGVNTFTSKYRVQGSNTGTFSNRVLIVIPLDV